MASRTSSDALMKQNDVIGFGSGSCNGRADMSSSLLPGLSSGLKVSQVSKYPGKTRNIRNSGGLPWLGFLS